MLLSMTSGRGLRVVAHNEGERRCLGPLITIALQIRNIPTHRVPLVQQKKVVLGSTMVAVPSPKRFVVQNLGVDALGRILHFFLPDYCIFSPTTRRMNLWRPSTHFIVPTQQETIPMAGSTDIVHVTTLLVTGLFRSVCFTIHSRVDKKIKVHFHCIDNVR